MGWSMRVCILAFALVIAVFASTSSARAGCWPSENFPIVCFLDTQGIGCVQYHALTSAKAVQYPQPRYSIYEFETTHWWKGGKEMACPPNKTVKLTGVWDRETGKAEETVSNGWSSWSQNATCTNNPWTGQGPSGVPLCSFPTNDPNAGLPATSAMLTAAQKDNLLHIQEPLHTRCQLLSPTEFGATSLAKPSIVEVIVAHHEFQTIQWHLLFLDHGDLGPWHEVAPPKPKAVMIWQGTRYSERRIATSRRKFWLNKPGHWKVVAIPTLQTAQMSATMVSLECPGADFDVQ